MAVQSTNSMVLALISYRLSDFYYIEDKLYCFIIIIVVREIRGREKKKKKKEGLDCWSPKSIPNPIRGTLIGLF